MSGGSLARWSLDEGEGGDDAEDLGVAGPQHLVWCVSSWCVCCTTSSLVRALSLLLRPVERWRGWPTIPATASSTSPTLAATWTRWNPLSWSHLLDKLIHSNLPLLQSLQTPHLHMAGLNSTLLFSFWYKVVLLA